jgi:serine/threonine-protein kinase HipA
MSDDVLAVWMDGFPSVAGYLARAEDGETAFIYEDDYVEDRGLPLSLSLPLEQREFGDADTRAFFANLLPENAQLEQLMKREGLERRDTVGLLRHLGADCAGAVSCLPIDAPPVKAPGILREDYMPLDDAVVARIVKSLHDQRRLPADVDDPSPVAGVQSKIAITVLPNGQFALPRPGVRVPTTHILKVPERGHGRDARLEEASALLAEGVRLEVSVPQAIKVGDIEALLIERFDRRVVDGTVTRIHQEDFAQALGLPSDLKYQRKGKPGRWFDAEAAVSVIDRTIDPAGARFAFLKATVLNLCIGNTDNHAKNHALLYDRGPIPRLAPLYDLLPIRLDHRFNHDLSFQIGKAKVFDDMSSDDFAAFCRVFGVSPDDMPRFLEVVVTPLVTALEAATPKLRSMGLKSFDDLVGRETERLAEVLALPVRVRERDHFPYERTGWGSGS